jgi:hypothetical protein
MKLSKSYSLKSQKAMKLSPFHFQLSIFIIEKRLPDSARRRLPYLASRQIGDSPTRRVDDSPTQRVDNSPTWRVDDSLTRRVGELAKITILSYSCGLQSSLNTKNHRFTLKALISCIEKCKR